MDEKALTADEFQRLASVSRETLARLSLYLDLLRRWQDRINLVGKSTLDDPWRRHFLDSAQLCALMPADAKIVTDLGSGAGFPGLVLAIILGVNTHLIESDARKCAFLREVARVTRAPATIHPARIETVSPWPSDIVVARALAPISHLLDYAWPFLSLSPAPGRMCLFLKSENFEQELTSATKTWNMRTEIRSSISDLRGRIICIRDLTPEVSEDGRHNDGSR
jgi:16S rRNA (guanine527-N7)-methyltransferase